MIERFLFETNHAATTSYFISIAERNIYTDMWQRYFSIILLTIVYFNIELMASYILSIKISVYSNISDTNMLLSVIFVELFNDLFNAYNIDIIIFKKSI